MSSWLDELDLLFWEKRLRSRRPARGSCGAVWLSQWLVRSCVSPVPRHIGRSSQPVPVLITCSPNRRRSAKRKVRSAYQAEHHVERKSLARVYRIASKIHPSQAGCHPPPPSRDVPAEQIEMYRRLAPDGCAVHKEPRSYERALTPAGLHRDRAVAHLAQTPPKFCGHARPRPMSHLHSGHHAWVATRV